MSKIKEVKIEKLEFPYNIQKRGGMFGVDGVTPDILFREIVDNTVDLTLKFRQSIKVKSYINQQGWCYIEDTGIGMPLYLDPDYVEQDQSILIDLMRKVNVGSNITKTEYSCGMNGTGSLIAVALSNYFFYIVNASKKDPKTLPKYVQEELNKGNHYFIFKAVDGHYQYTKVLNKGGLLDYFKELLPEKLNKALNDLPEDFGTVALFNPKKEFFETLKISYHGYPFKLMKTLFKYDNDLKDINTEFSLNDKDIDPYSFQSTFNEKLFLDKVFTQSVNIKTEDNHPIKFIYEVGYSADKFNFDFDGSVNLLKTSTGKHITIVQNAIASAFSKYNSLINLNDSKLGQRLFVLSFAIEPVFNSQDKTKLSRFNDKGYNEKEVIKTLADSFLKLMKENSEYFDLLCERIIEYKRATEKLSNIELLKSKIVMGDESDKKRIMSGQMSDVYECTSDDYSKRELYIVEGKSAMGGLLQTRNKLFQAIIPLN